MKDFSSLLLVFFAAILNIEWNNGQGYPRNDYCDIDYSVALGMIVSNGCANTDYDCDDLRLFLSQLIEKVYNPLYTSLCIFEDNLGGGGSEIVGSRESVVNAIKSLDCGGQGNVDEISYDVKLAQVLDDLRKAGGIFDEEKVVVISLCPAKYNDNSCSLRDEYDSDNNVEITVINIGNDVSISDQFVCLVDGGSTNSPNYNEYLAISDAIYDINHLQNEICGTSKITPNINRAHNVAPYLTTRQTPKPSPGPTPNPTPEPTPKPISNPNTDCGLGGKGKLCSDGKTARYDFVTKRNCNDLLVRWEKDDYIVAGQVCIRKSDDDEVIITYETNNEWYLNEVHTWIGCDKDSYPQFIGTYDNYPELSYFPMKDDNLEYPTISYSFKKSISEFDECKSIDFCHYCNNSPNELLLLYVIAEAKVKSYINKKWYYESAYLKGDWIFNYNDYWALQHQILLQVECC